jgi:hypothetical protein
MNQRTALPGTLSRQAFDVAEALANGVSASRLRGRDLDSPFWGVRSASGLAVDITGRALAYFSRASELTIVSHVSAAKLWGIPLPHDLQDDDRLHISVPPDTRSPRGTGVAGHHVRLHPTDGVLRAGLRITSQARTVCDLASFVKEEDLLAMVDFLIWWRRDDQARVPREEVFATVARHPTSRGIARMRSILPLASERSDSPPESIMRYRIIRAGLPAPTVNLELFDRGGQFLAMPDLVYPEFAMALDYEGDLHRTSASQWEKDIHRVPRLQDAGWHHTRISRGDLRDSRGFLTRLKKNLHSRGWSP